MPIYTIADLNIDIQYSHKYIDNLCKNYLAENQNIPVDFAVKPIKEDVEKDRAVLDERIYPTPYLESLSVYRQIARKILEYNGIIFHASVIEMEGKAYAFTAPSGTGKSTHCRLWLQAFPDKARIINGDKPLIRYIDDELYVAEKNPQRLVLSESGFQYIASCNVDMENGAIEFLECVTP